MAAKFEVPIVQYFTLNTTGRDFVIGDVHGRYDLVYEALSKANFDEQSDRLFCVGDLIDRGIYSSHVAEFLAKPYVHAIRGNHEDILLSLYEDGEPSDSQLMHVARQIGLTWWLDVDNENRQNILSALRKLPLVIEIESLRGLVGLVHADVDHDLTWQQFTEAVKNNDTHVIEEALWGRTRLTYNIEQEIEGIGRVYVGHTVQNNIKKLGNVVAIDTGAVFEQHLTMADIITQTQVILPHNRAEGKVHILHNIADEILPFGQYAAFPRKKI